MTTQEILEAARAARSALGLSSGEVRRAALLGMAEALCSPARQQAILDANAADLEAARGHISEVMLDRLALTPERISAMAKGIREVADLPDPVGRVMRRVERPNGLVIEKTAVPMGVIAIIYESRPNVTSDAAALAIKSGNACILRCGREAWRSANAIVAALREGLQANGLPETAVCLIEDTTHASANALMTAVGYVDLLIPRGGAGLIRACVRMQKSPASRPVPASATSSWMLLPSRIRRWTSSKTPRPAAPASATRRRCAWCTVTLRQSSCPSWPGGWALTALQRGCIRWSCGWTRVPLPSSLVPLQALPILTPSSWTTSWLSRSWTAWRRPSATSPRTPPATAKLS